MSNEFILLKPIYDESVRQDVLNRLNKERGNIFLRSSLRGSMPLKVGSYENGKLACTSAAPLNENDIKFSGSYTMSFSLGEERYIAECIPAEQNGKLILTVNELFNEQKRQTTRRQIDSKANVKFKINFINQKPANLEYAVFDMSSLGCAIMYSEIDNNLKVNDLIDADVVMPAIADIHVQGVVKNMRVLENEKLIVGVEFHHINYSHEDKITQAIMKL